MRRFLFAILPKSIAGRLVFWFLVIALASSGSLTLLIDAISSRSLITTVKAHLLEVHTRKTSALEDYAHDRAGSRRRCRGIPGWLRPPSGWPGSRAIRGRAQEPTRGR